MFPLAVVGGKVIATNFQADDIKAGTITADKIVANNISVTTAGVAGGYLPSGHRPVGHAAVTTYLSSGQLNQMGGYIDIDGLGQPGPRRQRRQRQTTGLYMNDLIHIGALHHKRRAV